MQHGAVERGGGGRGDVHGVHRPVHGAAARTAERLRAAAAPGERLLLGAVGVVRLGGRASACGGARAAPRATARRSARRRRRTRRARPPSGSVRRCRAWTPSSRSRCGMALTGVAVTTSSPKTVSSTSSGTARTSPMVYVSGVAAPQPMSPPASRMACMPSLRRRRAAGDVDLAEHADDERGQADHDPAVGLGLLGVPDEADGDDRRAVSARAGRGGRRRR